MIVQVLGCSGSISAGCKTTSFLIDDDVLVDAGTGVGDLTLEAMARIDHILVSHSHLDHIVSIPLLADSVMRMRRDAGKGPIEVHALAETASALRDHVFNGVIWPDFTRLPSHDHPFLKLIELKTGDTFQVGGKQVEVLPAVHTVPAVGFAIRQSSETGWWVYTGDTGPNPYLWKRLGAMNVAHLVIETAFSDAEQCLAQLSAHLYPSALGIELAHLAHPADVHITHIKPGEMELVMADIRRLETRHRILPLSAGASMVLEARPDEKRLAKATLNAREVPT